MIKIGSILPDDALVGSAHEENEVVSLISERYWERIIALTPEFDGENRTQQRINKHFPYNLIDKARNYHKRGDL
jgi:hypothetical protein